MTELASKYAELGIGIPSILLPSPQIDLSKWAVIACDQYTSHPDYWEKVASYIGSSPSALNLIFPEIYLEEPESEERISAIHRTMREYLSADILLPQEPGFIYVERKTSYTAIRKGLIVGVDLEEYDYHKGSKSLIRATEGTITDRLPPRIRIREEAPLELPHIMVLIDDPEKTVIEPLALLKSDFDKLYDFDLMMNSGHLTGYKVDKQPALQGILSGLQRLADPKLFSAKYGVSDQPLLFAVGDGNHSLATAKAVWEKMKSTAIDQRKIMAHPARYALVELVNLYDEGLTFEPIHRLLFNIDHDQILTFFKERGWRVDFGYDFSTMARRIRALSSCKDSCFLGFTIKEGAGILSHPEPPGDLTVSSLQGVLDSYLKINPLVKIDYVHGDDALSSLGAKEGNIGFYLPAIDKKELFRTVMLEGALPRKTFSMGEAEEKRFYLESRRIL